MLGSRQTTLWTGLAGALALALGAARARRATRLRRRIQWSLPTGNIDVAVLAARSLGRELPAVALLHGLFASGRYWGATFDELASESLLVVPDLAGFGRSLHEASGFGPDDHADLVAKTLLRLKAVDRPAVVGAHSLGCLVALRVAAQHPEMVAGVVAFAPPLYASTHDARTRLARASMLLRLFVLHPALAEVACDWMCDHPTAAARLGRRLRPELPPALAEDRLSHTYRSYSETLSKVILAAGASAWLDEINVPIWLVAGDADTLMDAAFLAELPRRHPNVTLSTWKGAGHELPLTHAASCVTELKRMRATVAITSEQRTDPG